MFLQACSSATSPDAFVSDRNVTGINVPNLDTVRLRTLPDSLSGWQLTWSSPLSTDGWQRTFVFTDTLTSDQKSNLANGSWTPSGYPSYRIVPIDSQSLDLPTSVFTGTGCPSGCRGTSAPTDRIFYFTVWAQYTDGDLGEAIRYRLYLGDEYPPELPAIQREVGTDSAAFTWDSVYDQTSRFVSHQFGQLSALKWKLWKGMYQLDSALVKMRVDSVRAGVIHCSVVSFSRGTDTTDWSAKVTDSSVINTGNTRLIISGLRPYHSYTLVTSFIDRSGQTSSSTSQYFTTRDSIPPQGATITGDSLLSPTGATIFFTAPTDSFDASGTPLISTAPNQNIATIIAFMNGRGVDTLTLSDSTYIAGTVTSAGNWSWNGYSWSWTWPYLNPGSTDTVTFAVTDKSGNDQQKATAVHIFTMPRDTSVQNLSCAAGYVAVGGGWTLSSSGDTIKVAAFCMEEHPHADATGAPNTSVSFSGAQTACADDGARLCTEWEWQHACEGAGDSTALNYGLVNLSGESHSDTLTLLKSTCGLLSGDSTWLTRHDSRCLGPWGVHEMAGPVFEITSSLYDSSSTDFAGVPVIKSGSWKTASNSSASYASTCRYRNYPAYSDSITVSGSTIQHPFAGFTSGFGFRCCKSALAATARRYF